MVLDLVIAVLEGIAVGLAFWILIGVILAIEDLRRRHGGGPPSSRPYRVVRVAPRGPKRQKPPVERSRRIG